MMALTVLARNIGALSIDRAKFIDTFSHQAYRDASFGASEDWCDMIARSMLASRSARCGHIKKCFAEQDV